MAIILIENGYVAYLCLCVDVGVISGILGQSMHKIMGHTKPSFQTFDESMVGGMEVVGV